MNAIQFPLKFGHNGLAVVDLQDALLQCLERKLLSGNDDAERADLVARLQRERAVSTFDKVTQKVLSLFQENQRLQLTGDVDESTAQALNLLLREWGLLRNTAAQTTLRIVAGAVVPAAGDANVGLAGWVVRAYHEGDTAAIRLGQDSTDSAGRFTIRYEGLPSIPDIHLRVTVENRDGKVLIDSKVIRQARPIETMTLQLPAVPLPPAERQQIAGIVRWPSGQPAPGVTLKLYRLVGFGDKDVQLAETQSLPDGHYTLAYAPEPETTHVDIRLRKPDGTEVVLTKPLAALSAEQRQHLELVAPADGVKVASEYERMCADVVTAIGGGIEKLAEAQEGSERQDITLLARRTGWDARLLALNCWAQRLVVKDHIGMSAEALYGLLRVGLPADKRLLAAVASEQIKQGLQKACKSGVIDLDANTIDAQVAAFVVFAGQANLAGAALGSQSTYAELLASTGLTDGEQKTFAALFFAHSGDADGLWKKASEAGFTADQIKTLQLHGKFALLAGNSAVLTARLMKLGVKDPVDLVAKGLYTAEAWTDELFDEAGIAQQDRAHPKPASLKKLEGIIPSAYQGADVLARAGAFAADMARKIHRSYPTQVLAERMTGEAEFHLGDAHAKTVELLKRCAAKGYRLGQTPVSTFLEQQEGFTGDALHTAQARNLKALHATYSIAPSDEAQATLLQMGIRSGHDVVALKLEHFEQRFAEKYRDLFKIDPADGIARKVHGRAVQISSVVYSLFGAAQSAAGSGGVSAMPSALPISEVDRENLIRRVPTMESLFGSLDYCECQDCQSVLSPAAYFVDLLQYVDIEAQTWANTLALWQSTHGGKPYPHTFVSGPQAGEAMKPYDVLVQRRPDLPHLALTCENTHTALPYIDIVNEILEYHAAHGQLAEAAVRDTGDASTAELLAEPQHVIDAAYQALREATYPLALPFDRSLEMVRQFCVHAGTPLHEVLQILRRSDDLKVNGSVGRAEMFVESLGLSPAEAALFTRATPLINDAWHDLYGWPALRAAIQSPQNAPEASVSLASADVSGLVPGMACSYFDVSANANAAEVNTLTAIGPVGSGGMGRCKLVFANAWVAAPVAGDLLVLDAPTMLRSAKALARRLGLSYREITQVVMSGFVNPGLSKLTLLYRARLSIGDAHRYQVDHAALVPIPAAPTAEQQKKLDDIAAFEQRLSDFAAEAGSDLATLKARVLGIDFSQMLVLADPDAGCNFDLTTLQHADGSSVTPIELVRINLFVRLWRRLGWSIEETDRALQVLTPRNVPFDALDANLQKRPLASALVHLAHLKALDERLKFGANGRLKLLTLWSDIATTGNKPLYVQLFLGRGVAKAPAAFESALGEYLSAMNVPLVDHMVTLQAALGLTATDIEQVLQDAGMQLAAGGGAGARPQAMLTLPVVSVLYRHALLAKALKLSIADLLTLRTLSGLDPFRALHTDALATLPEDSPFSQTLAFVDLVDLLRAAGLKVGDVEALVRHRLNNTKLLRDDDGDLLVLLKALADGVQAIRAEHAVPADPGDISDEELLRKLGLVLPPEVANAFLSMLSGTVTYLALDTPGAGETPLETGSLAGAEGIVETRHDAVRNVQYLRFAGVLLDTQKTSLLNRYPLPASSTPHVPSPLLTRLLEQVQQQARDFFTQHLRKSASGAVPASGFLDDADFDTLFAPLPADAMAAGVQLKARRARLVLAFLPYLQQRLVRQFIVQSMVGRSGADAAAVESLVTDTTVLNVGGPLLDPLAALASQGLTVSYLAANGQVLGSKPTQQADTAAVPAAPAGTTALLFEGCLEVPVSGAWRFHIELDKANATAALRFPHRTDSVLVEGIAATDATVLQEFIELKAGVPYRFEWRLGALGGGQARLLVQGENLPKGALSRLTLRTANDLRAAARAVALLDKLQVLMRTLGITEVELHYIGKYAADFGNLNLSTWPTSRVGDDAGETAAAVQCCIGLRRLLELSQLKRDMGLTGNDLVAVFEANSLSAADKLTREVYPRLARLTGRSEATIQAVAETLWAVPAFASDVAVRRLWDALRVVDRFGVGVATLAAGADLLTPGVTESRRADIARDVKDAIKARAGELNWPHVAQPIFDRLRQRQRDALVAHALQTLGYERLEQLYEHFLIDPGMEPVVQTSRVRLAIASVQLFVQRCFLNLEPQVHPSVLDAKHWEWMRRNPVWAGNRKLWLFPENVLEPEFRDDKTPLFEALEGALLQGDVSSDLVEDAFLAYLRQLDKIARLDMVAMHLEDNVDASQRVLHVFGRTYGQPHEYFYRRCRNGSWTTWEPVNVTIQGDHLAPVIWRERLFLFWVTFMEKADPKPSMENPTSGATIAGATLGNLIADLNQLSLNKMVELQLHWAQYQSGVWTTAESGGSAVVIAKSLPAAFQPRDAFIHVSKEFTDEGVEGGVFVHLSGFDHAFYLAGRNATPEQGVLGSPPQHVIVSASTVAATRHAGTKGSLNVRYTKQQSTDTTEKPLTRTEPILQNVPANTVLACNSAMAVLGISLDAVKAASDPNAAKAALDSGLPELAALTQPFFYQDNRHTFFVQPEVRETLLEDPVTWITRTTVIDSIGIFKGDLLDKLEVIPQFKQKWPPLPMTPTGKDPFALPKISGDPVLGLDWLVNPKVLLTFDQSTVLSNTGQLGLSLVDRGSMKDNQAEPSKTVPLHPASESGTNQTALVIASPTEFALAKSAFEPTPSVMFGESGLNAQLRDALSDSSIQQGSGPRAFATPGMH